MLEPGVPDECSTLRKAVCTAPDSISTESPSTFLLHNCGDGGSGRLSTDQSLGWDRQSGAGCRPPGPGLWRQLPVSPRGQDFFRDMPSSHFLPFFANGHSSIGCTFDVRSCHDRHCVTSPALSMWPYLLPKSQARVPTFAAPLHLSHSPQRLS